MWNPKKSEKEFYVFAVRRRFMKTRPQSCPHQCLTSTLLRYFCLPTLQLHTSTWTQQLLWPGSSVASLWWFLYTGALINMGIISHTYTLDFSLESPLSITIDAFFRYLIAFLMLPERVLKWKHRMSIMLRAGFLRRYDVNYIPNISNNVYLHYFIF